jgi:phosphatidylserine decarboxylase
MNHKGKASKAAAKLIGIGLVVFVVLGVLLKVLGLPSAISGAVGLVPAIVFVAFTLYFFRDPDPKVPEGADVVVAPGHGKVDLIDETDEPNVLRGRCRRISIFLSVFDVHIQQAPVAGKVSFLKHTPGAYLNAMRADCADHNENVLIGLTTSGSKPVNVGVRLITGLIARRIVPWISEGTVVSKGERISLIQFGSRVNLYLPLNSRIEVKLGDRVVGGETVMARLGSN